MVWSESVRGARELCSPAELKRCWAKSWWRWGDARRVLTRRAIAATVSARAKKQRAEMSKRMCMPTLRRITRCVASCSLFSRAVDLDAYFVGLVPIRDGTFLPQGCVCVFAKGDGMN